jgi:hypothetical protein
MSGAIPPLPNTPSWLGAQLKHRDNFTFTFTQNHLDIDHDVCYEDSVHNMPAGYKRLRKVETEVLRQNSSHVRNEP